MEVLEVEVEVLEALEVVLEVVEVVLEVSDLGGKKGRGIFDAGAWEEEECGKKAVSSHRRHLSRLSVFCMLYTAYCE